MEASGVVNRPLPCFPGAGSDALSHSSLSSQSINLRLLSSRESRARRFRGFSNSGFGDSGHVQYYRRSALPAIRCGSGQKEKVKEKEASPKKITKERLKLLKGLSRDLSKFSAMDVGLDPQNHGLIDEVKGNMISEATDLLLGQLQQLKAEGKAMKRKRKEENAKLKAGRMHDCESSSSSSSESSDSECVEVVDMSSLKSEALVPAVRNCLVPAMQGTTLALPSTMTQEEKTNEFQSVMQEATLTVASTMIQVDNPTELQSVIHEALLPIRSPMNQVGRMTQESGVQYSSHNQQGECCTPTSASFTHFGIGGSCGGGKSVSQVSAGRIEVCMGGKCKKSGAATLLEEFRKMVGSEGAVVGCKCMGKCKDGPNVRVMNCSDGVQDQGVDSSVRAPTNPLCIGVGFEDVGLIVSNFFGAAPKEGIDLAVAS